MKRLRAIWLAFLDPGLVAETDELSGALTRRRFGRLVEAELARAKRGQSLSVAYLDLDNLTKINNERGHDVGDLYIREFAQTILANIRPYDLFARWGGDEFVLLLPGVDLARAEEIICRIHARFPCFSWGTSLWSEGDDLKSFLKRADTKMYQMKDGKEK